MRSRGAGNVPPSRATFSGPLRRSPVRGHSVLALGAGAETDFRAHAKAPQPPRWGWGQVFVPRTQSKTRRYTQVAGWKSGLSPGVWVCCSEGRPVTSQSHQPLSPGPARLLPAASQGLRQQPPACSLAGSSLSSYSCSAPHSAAQAAAALSCSPIKAKLMLLSI